MARIAPSLTRARYLAAYVPAGALKFVCKVSGAVVYAYTSASSGRPTVMAFAPKGQKPALHLSYRTPEAREAAARAFLAKHGENVTAKAARRVKPSDLVPGDILNASWGYDQTNVDFYEVTAVAGAWVTLHKLAAVRELTGHDTGRCVPQSGDYVGEPLRRMDKGGYVMITSYASASKWNTSKVAGVAVGPAVAYSFGH